MDLLKMSGDLDWNEPPAPETLDWDTPPENPATPIKPDPVIVSTDAAEIVEMLGRAFAEKKIDGFSCWRIGTGSHTSFQVGLRRPGRQSYCVAIEADPLIALGTALVRI